MTASSRLMSYLPLLRYFTIRVAGHDMIHLTNIVGLRNSLPPLGAKSAFDRCVLPKSTYFETCGCKRMPEKCVHAIDVRDCSLSTLQLASGATRSTLRSTPITFATKHQAEDWSSKSNTIAVTRDARNTSWTLTTKCWCLPWLIILWPTLDEASTFDGSRSTSTNNGALNQRSSQSKRRTKCDLHVSGTSDTIERLCCIGTLSQEYSRF